MQFLPTSKALLFVVLTAVSFVLVVSEQILATAPNPDVLLTNVLFMEVLQPASIRYTYRIRPAKNFGTSFDRKYSNIELAVANPYDGCSTLSNAHFLAGKIVLVQRGECSFVTKSLTVEAAGGIAVVVADNDIQNDQSFVDMVDDNTEREVNIPATFLLGKDGHMIKDTLDRMGLATAVINIPLNITGSSIHHVSQPPWTLW